MDKRKVKEEEKEVVERFYTNLGKILDDREILWKDLAKLIGVSANTMSSMKSQKINPPLSRIIKIADALEVSTDELIGNKDVPQELYDIFWSIPKDIASKTKQEEICDIISSIIKTTSGSPKASITRKKRCIDIVHSKLDVIEMDEMKTCWDNVEVPKTEEETIEEKDKNSKHDKDSVEV